MRLHYNTIMDLENVINHLAERIQWAVTSRIAKKTHMPKITFE